MIILAVRCRSSIVRVLLVDLFEFCSIDFLRSPSLGGKIKKIAKKNPDGIICANLCFEYMFYVIK